MHVQHIPWVLRTVYLVKLLLECILKKPVKFCNKQMIGFPTVKIVNFVHIFNVTHVHTFRACFTSILHSITTKFDKQLVLVVIKMHAKFQNWHFNGLKVIAFRNSQEFSHFRTCKTSHARRARILHQIKLKFSKKVILVCLIIYVK